jgi:hypothetical protein
MGTTAAVARTAADQRRIVKAFRTAGAVTGAALAAVCVARM